MKHKKEQHILSISPHLISVGPCGFILVLLAGFFSSQHVEETITTTIKIRTKKDAPKPFFYIMILSSFTANKRRRASPGHPTPLSAAGRFADTPSFVPPQALDIILAF
eukprot:gene2122-1298_t